MTLTFYYVNLLSKPFIKELIFSCLICLFIMQSETKASDTELKFAGFRMGMTKDEVVSNLKDEELYIVDEGGRTGDFAFTHSENTGSWENCGSEFLEIGTIRYGDQILEYPRLYFVNEKLTYFSAIIRNNKDFDYDKLINTLKINYGKPSKEKKGYLIFRKNGNILEISDNKYGYGTSFSFFSDVQKKECEKTKIYKERSFFDNLITKDGNSFKLLGIGLGERKKDVVNYLLTKYDSSSLYYDYNADYESNPINWDQENEIIAKVKMPNSEYLSVYLNFYKQKLYSIEVQSWGWWEYGGSLYFFGITDKLIDTFQHRNKDLYIKVTKDRPEGAPAGSLLKCESNNVILTISNYQYSTRAYIGIEDQVVIKNKTENSSKQVRAEVKEIISHFPDSEVVSLKMNEYFPLRFKDNPYNESKSDNISEYISSYSNWRNIDLNYYPKSEKIVLTHNLEIDNDGLFDPNSEIKYYNYDDANDKRFLKLQLDKYLTQITRVYIVFVDKRIVSISFEVNMTDLFSKKWRDSKLNLNTVFYEEMLKLYGQPSVIEKKTRKSIYWIVNGNLIEVITEEDGVELSNPLISFRKYRSNDLLFKKSKVKSLTD